jgi:hypothetical protein
VEEILAAISNAIDTVNMEYSTLAMSDGTYHHIMRELNNAYVTTLRQAK